MGRPSGIMDITRIGGQVRGAVDAGLADCYTTYMYVLNFMFMLQ
jgi:hypothetical protein